MAGGKTVTESDVKKLLDQASDKNEKKKIFAVNEVVKIVNAMPKSVQPAVIDKLLELTADDDKNVKRGAIEALGEFGKDLPESHRDKIVNRLLECFHLFDIKVPDQAVDSISKIAEGLPKKELKRVVDDILSIIQNKSHPLTIAPAVSALGLIGKLVSKSQLESAVESMVYLTHDNDEYVQFRTAEAILNLVDILPSSHKEAVILGLNELVQHKDRYVNVTAKEALKQLGEKVEEDKSPFAPLDLSRVKRGSQEEKRVDELLLQLCEAKSGFGDNGYTGAWEIQSKAIDELKELGEILPQSRQNAVIDQLVYLSRFWVGKRLGAGMDSGAHLAVTDIFKRFSIPRREAVIDRLLVLTQNENADVRLAAIEVLEYLHSIQIPQPLELPETKYENITNHILKLTSDSDWFVCRTAISTLSKFSDITPKSQGKNIIDRLLQLTTDNRWGIRSEAALALAGFRDIIPKSLEIKVFDSLNELKNDEDAWVSKQANEALGKLGRLIPEDQRVDHMDNLLDSALESVRKSVKSLKIPKNKPKIDVLLSYIIRKDFYISDAASKALVNIWDSLPEMHQQTIINRLIELTYPKKEKAGKSSFFNSIRPHVTHMFGELKVFPNSSKEAVFKRLLKLLGDKDSSVRWSASYAIGQIKKHMAVSDRENMVEALLKQTNASNKVTREFATRTFEYLIGDLNESQNKEVMNRLIILLSDSENKVREAAAFVLRPVSEAQQQKLKPSIMNIKTLKEKLKDQFLIDLEHECPKSEPYGDATYLHKPTGKVDFFHIGPWLWVKLRINCEGEVSHIWDDSSADHDEFWKCAMRDWIGPLENAPKKVTKPEDLDKWALVNMKFQDHMESNSTGRAVENILKDGTVIIKVAGGKIEEINLNK